jgi:hypothetical protein
MAPGEWQELAPATRAFRSDTFAKISVLASRQLLSPSLIPTCLLLGNTCRDLIIFESFARHKASSLVAMKSFRTTNSANCSPEVLVTNLLTTYYLLMNLGTKVVTLPLCDQRRYLYPASYPVVTLSDH